MDRTLQDDDIDQMVMSYLRKTIMICNRMSGFLSLSKAYMDQLESALRVVSYLLMRITECKTLEDLELVVAALKQHIPR